MKESFQYEWWTVSVRLHTGTIVYIYKGKSKAHVIKQIKREVKTSNSPENLAKGWRGKQPILEVIWDTLTFDHRGYNTLR